MRRTQDICLPNSTGGQMDGDPGRPTDRRTIIYLWELPVGKERPKTGRPHRDFTVRFLRIFLTMISSHFFFHLCTPHNPPPSCPADQPTDPRADRSTDPTGDAFPQRTIRSKNRTQCPVVEELVQRVLRPLIRFARSRIPQELAQVYPSYPVFFRTEGFIRSV